MNTEWIATDLDGTLFSRAHSHGAIAATWRKVENGSLVPSSWMPATRHALFSRLSTVLPLIPVTARDADSFARVKVESVPLQSGAILANGAILLNPGTMQSNAEWDSRMATELAPWTPVLNEMMRVLAVQSGGSVIPRLVESHTPHPAYMVAKAAEGFWSTETGLKLREALAPFGCRVAELGRELQVLPPPVSKRNGLHGFSMLHHGGVPPLLAFGDMVEDLGFLLDAEFAAAPVDSPLARRWRDAY